MSTQPLNSNDRLRLGIEAARTGKENEARRHLIAVLRQDPNNIPAMLWLAFVLPSPQDTIRLLERVLLLDPNNERAKSGIRWAKVRLGLPPEEAKSGDSAGQTTAAPSSSTPEIGEDSIRSILLSEEVQQQAKKGALAHRARRTINPFIGLIFITGAMGLMAIGLGALVFVPPETLAAWMPAASPYLAAQSDVPAVSALDTPTRVIEVPSKPGRKGFISLADYLDPQQVRKRVASDLSAPDAEPSQTPAETALPSDSQATQEAALSATQPGAVAIDPLQLVGPVGPFPPEDVVSPTAGHLQLAHQPAYPGEKWIEVNVTTQRVIAWEGDKPVMSFVVSTGLPATPTVLGKFNIYWKLESALMVGYNYYLPEVPYTMYFYGGYSLHGTYWHNNFGQPMSHGCVNLKTEDAQKLFEWADPILPPGQTEITSTANNPGTLVVIHE